MYLGKYEEMYSAMYLTTYSEGYAETCSVKYEVKCLSRTTLHCSAWRRFRWRFQVWGRRGEHLEGVGKSKQHSIVRRDNVYKSKMPKGGIFLNPKDNGSCARSIEVTKKGWNRDGMGIVDLLESRNGIKDRGIPNNIEYKWIDQSTCRRDPWEKGCVVKGRFKGSGSDVDKLVIMDVEGRLVGAGRGIIKDDVRVGDSVNVIKIESIECRCKIQGVTMGDNPESCTFRFDGVVNSIGDLGVILKSTGVAKRSRPGEGHGVDNEIGSAGLSCT